MSTYVRQLTCWGVVMFVLMSMTPAAWAFYPMGGFNEFGQLRYVVWPDFEMDTNNDGQITSDEGVNYLVEGGDRGFTPEEIQIIDEAFEVWQDVPTSYVSFRNDGTVYDPIFVGTTPDFLSVVALQITNPDPGEEADPSEVRVPGLSFPNLGVTITTIAVADTELTVGSQTVAVSAGTIIDRDIIIDETYVRRQEGQSEPFRDLKAILVHEIGHFLGLDHTPLSNLREVTGPDNDTELVENPAMQLTGPDGIARMIGVTPTMFPFYFDVIDEFGEREAGATDLAPDDISGVSWLYPRGNQSQFFSLRHEARTRTRVGSGLPSEEIPGANITAWADTDNDVNTPRVPLFSTLTGMWEPWPNTALQGYFDMLGLWKQMEVPQATGALFNVSYTFTCNPMNGLGFERQAPTGLDPSDFDSLQGPDSFSVFPRSTSFYNNVFQSETFHEIENITDVSSKDAGTPMVWSFAKNTLVSMDSGKTLPSILPYKWPMFGDPVDTVCPFNVLESKSASETVSASAYGVHEFRNDRRDDRIMAASADGAGPGGPTMFRSFRDTVLMETAVGVMLVDAYYTVSPAIAQFLLGHNWAFNAFATLSNGVVWIMEHAIMLSVLFAGLIIGGLIFRHRRKALAMTSLFFLMAMLFLAMPANAQIAYVTSEELLAGSDAVISGTITSTEGRWASQGARILTDVVVQVDDSAKGGLKDDSSLVFTLAGGRAGNIIMRVSEMPTFTDGDEVILYLKQDNTYGYVLYGGLRARLTVGTSNKDGEKYVYADNEITTIALKEDKAAMGKTEDESATSSVQKIPLDEYMAYLKSVAKAQKEAEEEAEKADK